MATIQFKTHHGNMLKVETIEDVELTPQGVDAAYAQTVYGDGGWLVDAESSMYDFRTESMNQRVAALKNGEVADFGWTDAQVVMADY